MIPLSAPASIASFRNASLMSLRAGDPERDVAHPARDVDLRPEPLPQLGDRAERVRPELVVDRDREDERVDVDVAGVDARGEARPRPSARRSRRAPRCSTACPPRRPRSRRSGPPTSTAIPTASRRSSEAEFSIGRDPGRQASRPSPMISGCDESTEIGTSVQPCTCSTSQRIAAFWSGSIGESSSTLTSRNAAPGRDLPVGRACAGRRARRRHPAPSAIPVRIAIATCFRRPDACSSVA